VREEGRKKKEEEKEEEGKKEEEEKNKDRFLDSRFLLFVFLPRPSRS